MRLITPVALITTAGLAVTGCGGGGAPPATTEATTPAPAPTTAPAGGAKPAVTIAMTEFQLAPANPSVASGEARFTADNRGGTVHALEVEGPEGEVETRELQPGESQTITVALPRPGRYVMYCPVGSHREQGMEGRVVVR